MKKAAAVSESPKTATAASFFRPHPGLQPGTEETRGDPFFMPAIQPKLMVGAADSPAEKEADRMADQVVQRLAEPAPVLRAPEKEEEEKVQRQAGEEPSQAKTTTPLKKSTFEFMLTGSDAQKFLDGLILALPKQSSIGGTGPKTPQAPERVSLWTRNNFSIGLRLSLPTLDLTQDPKYIIGGAEIRQARFKSAVENWTGNVPTGLDAIDLGQGFKVAWSIFATQLAPDLASGLSSAVSSPPKGGTEFDLQLDFYPILEGGLKGGGLSFRVIGDWDRYVFGKLFSGSRKEPKTGAGAPLRRKTEQEDEPVQAKHADSAAPASVTATLQSSKGGGQPLPGTLRTPIESAFGADFGSVRIHTGAEAAHMNQSLHAQAFTHGRDIYFNEGKYRPETTEGKHLLAHELGHVAQQRGGEKKDVKYVRRRTTIEDILEPGKNATKADWIKWEQGLKKVIEEIDERNLLIDSIQIDYLPKINKSLENSFENHIRGYSGYYKKHLEMIKKAGDNRDQRNELIGFVISVVIGATISYFAPALIPIMRNLVGWKKAMSDVLRTTTSTYLSSRVKDMVYSPRIKGFEQPKGAIDISELIDKLFRFINENFNLLQILYLKNVLLKERVEKILEEIDCFLNGREVRRSVSYIKKYTLQYMRENMYLPDRDEMKKFIKDLEQVSKMKLSAISGLELEQDIWILWISTIDKENSDFLDENIIENYLKEIKVIGPGKSRLGLDFGSVTLESDELKAIERAKTEKWNIRVKYSKMAKGFQNILNMDIKGK